MIGREKIIKWGLVVIVLMLISGCASMAHKKELLAFNTLYSSGRYIEAANNQIQKKDRKKLNSSELLQALQAATALRYAQQYQQSSSLFDACEVIFKDQNEHGVVADVASNVGAVLVNDAVLDYRGKEYDGVMVNTYKALNFWQEDKRDLARIEFNRALDRQRRAKERFAVEIAKLKEDLAKEQEDNPETDINRNINNPEIDSILQEKYANLYQFKPYPDFINPFTTYMAGLFFMSEGDYPKATTLLKEAYGMVENNSTVADDFASVEGMMGGQNSKTKHTWVIFENGLGPEKEELRIDLPILLLTQKVKYTGIALPKLKFRNQAYSHLTINNSSGKVGQTSILSSMDRVVQTEFKKRYTATVARAITSTLIKTTAQYVAQEYLGTLGGFAAAAYQIATTAADIRIWTALPKEFQIAKVQTPNNGIIILETPTGSKINITVPKNNNALIYVKIPTSATKAVYDVIKM